MFYVAVFGILVFLAGLAVLGIAGWRTLRRVNDLRRSIRDASDRIAAASAALEDVKPAQPR